MRNRRTVIGFLLSFLLHLLIFILFFLSFNTLKFTPPPPSSKNTKISLNLSQFVPPAPKPAPKPAVKPVPKPLPPKQPSVQTPPKPVKTAQKKHVEKKKGFEVAKKSENENNATNVAKAPKPAEKPPKKVAKKKTHRKKRLVQKKPLPKTFRLPKRSKDPLANALLGSGRSMKRMPARSPSSGTNRMITQLYGKEFYSFTKTQRKFIKNHLSEIYRITQNTLYLNGYPEVAVRTRQQGVNVVSFYLHPNGAISNLRLVKPMGYEALDKNTIAVIQIAYKDYPRPKTKTKIVFYVNYQLY